MRDFTESDFCFIMPARFSFTSETGEGGREGSGGREGEREEGGGEGGREEDNGR